MGYINSGYTVRDGEWSVGECGIINLDSIIPIQPETVKNLHLSGERPLGGHRLAITD